MIRWLVTGAAGMLGQELVSALECRQKTVHGLTRQHLDITDEAAVRRTVQASRPDIVVNCAAWTAVDDAEAHEDAALKVNGHGPGYLAAACADSGARLVHMSTDYVFAGDARRPYSERDTPVPRTAYGRTKLAGERAVIAQLPRCSYVVRTAWLYGAHGPNFIRTMIRLAHERPHIEVVDDQLGQPTWTMDVVGQILALIRSRATPGVYHATSSGQATWFELAREVFQLLGMDPARVSRANSSQFPRPAPRPSYSVLGHNAWAAAAIEPIGDWHLALRRAFPVLTS
jgi:dTDP-4-dehydrorhamnose reductase